MTTFSLVTEGITDQVVLEALLVGHYKHQIAEEIDVVPVQPVRDATDEARQGDFGGWEKVLEFCTYADRISEILALNDYLVIQIDTDCCDHQNFGVPLTEGGTDRSEADIVTDVVARISARLSAPVLAENGRRILFAIAVHSVECWLLPLYCTANHQKEIKSCERHLTKCLDRQNSSYKKDYYFYEYLAKPFKKAKNTLVAAGRNDSLSLFINALPNISVA